MFDTILWFVKSPLICVSWIVVGAIAGALARRIMGSTDKPFVQDLILGIAGAVVGGFLLGFVNVGTPSGGLALVIFNIVLATLAASLLIFLGRQIGGKPAQKSRD